MQNLRKPKILRNLHNQCVFFVLLSVTGIHILAWHSKTFTNWYRLCLFPFETGILGRISNLFRGSAGEVLIAAGICLVMFEILLLLVFIIRRYWKSCRLKRTGDNNGSESQNKKFSRFWKWNRRFICWVFVYIYVTETLNCYVLYHASTIEEQYYSDSAQQETDGLIKAYTEAVVNANALSKQVMRDSKGRAVYEGSDLQLYEECKKAMQKQGEKYPYLAGYYPNPKPVRASHFMSQQYLLGIYFPFTMEANYNAVMYPVNIPATVCHEYSHCKGIILEDEANYFGFVACIESEEPYLQYSGYLSVLGYLVKQVRESVPEKMRKKMVSANEQVIKDDVFLTEEQWEQVEEKAVVSTETVNKATDVFLEKNLTMNGIEDGMKSYSRVVRLVVKYYGG